MKLLIGCRCCRCRRSLKRAKVQAGIRKARKSARQQARILLRKGETLPPTLLSVFNDPY